MLHKSSNLGTNFDTIMHNLQFLRTWENVTAKFGKLHEKRYITDRKWGPFKSQIRLK